MSALPLFFPLPPARRRLVRALAGLAGALALIASAHAESVLCHYTYGGETKQLEAAPVASPYEVGHIAVGSFFRFRVVFQKWPRDLASIKIYAYSDRDESLVPIHQATYPYPPRPQRGTGYGFTGIQNVYEPLRDGELHYWCELRQRPAPARRNAP